MAGFWLSLTRACLQVSETTLRNPLNGKLVKSCLNLKQKAGYPITSISRSKIINNLTRGMELEQPSIKFGTQEALEHVRSLTDVLEIVEADSNHLLSNVTSTCDLADQVSAKVRKLDLALAQSYVKSTLFHLDATVERSNCIDGVEQALEGQDYESAAKYVQRFIQIDSEYKDSGQEQRGQLMESKEQLESIVRKKLSAAMDQRDHPTVLRFIRLYTPFRLEEEGLQVYVSYLRKVIGTRSRLEFEHLVELMEQNNQAQAVNFVGCLTNLFKDILLAIEDNHEILRSLCGEDGIVYSICELQEECDSRGTLIMKKYMEYRKLSKLSPEINAQNTNLLNVGGAGVGSKGPHPREVELYLEEILSLMQLGKDYNEFMVSKIKGLTNVNPDLGPRATKAFRSGSFSKAVQDITGFYVILEGFFVVENVRKAIRIDEQLSMCLTVLQLLWPVMCSIFCRVACGGQY